MSRFEGYEPLITVLHHALVQAAEGKGVDRHGNGLPFAEQPMAEITRDLGLGFPLGQARKKGQEAASMVDRDELSAARRELLGAIVYLAGAVMVIDEWGARTDAERADEGPSGGFAPIDTGQPESPPHGPENGISEKTGGRA